MVSAGWGEIGSGPVGVWLDLRSRLWPWGVRRGRFDGGVWNERWKAQALCPAARCERASADAAASHVCGSLA